MRNFGLMLILLVIWLTGHSFLAVEYSAITENIHGLKWDIDFINKAGNFFLTGIANLINTFKYIGQGDLVSFLELIKLNYVDSYSIVYTIMDMVIIILNGVYLINELVIKLLGLVGTWLNGLFKFLS